jgi:phenylacetyl-CoA:acceptor oxidoreductase
MNMEAAQPKSVKHVPSYCYNCVSGPDLMTVKVVDGIATEIEPNFAAADVHPAKGKVCVKAYGLIQKTYNAAPHRHADEAHQPEEGASTRIPASSRSPGTRRSTSSPTRCKDGPRQGHHRRGRPAARRGEPRPRRHAVELHGHLPGFPLCLGAEVDFSFGSGQGVKCVHSEHLYGEYWHRGFTVAADTPDTAEYNIAVGANVDVTGGVCAP